MGWGLLSAWAGQELGGEAEKSFFSMADTQEVGGGGGIGRKTPLKVSAQLL